MKASKTHNIAGVKEKLELEIANLASEYYQAKYVNGSVDENNVGLYVLGKLTQGDFENDYTLTVSESKATLTSKQDSNVKAIATIGNMEK